MSNYVTRTILLLCLVAGLTACSQKTPVVTNISDQQVKAIQVRSTAFDDGQPIPAKYTEDGQDLSPPLRWDAVPEGVQEFVLICDDPDAPTAEPWVHWLIYKIPAATRELPEGLPTEATLDAPIKARQGTNSWPDGRTSGYRGPAPPPGGVHHYHFKLYALDRELDLLPGLAKTSLLKAIEGHVLAEGELVGTYQR